MSRGRKRLERPWHTCPRCGLKVVTKKLHGRPLRKWHAICWAAHRGLGKPRVLWTLEDGA